MLRTEVVKALVRLGAEDGNKAATRVLRDLYQSGKVKKQRDGNAMRYWTASAAPMDAE